MTLYGNQMKRKMPQRVYWRDCISRSGPNMKPPKSIAPVAKNASASLPVKPQAAAKVGAARIIVIASCVFPEGINRSQESAIQNTEASQLFRFSNRVYNTLQSRKALVCLVVIAALN